VRTEEDGSGWAAQRLGGRLDVRSRRETAERAPIASTPVANRPRVTLALTLLMDCGPVGEVAYDFRLGIEELVQARLNSRGGEVFFGEANE